MGTKILCGLTILLLMIFLLASSIRADGNIITLSSESSGSGSSSVSVSSNLPECYQNNDCRLFYNSCTCGYECISKNTPYNVACPKICENNLTVIPDCECINNKCGEVIYSEGETKERCYSDNDCKNKQNWACAVSSGYSVEERCNITTGECYCDVRKNEIEANYNEEFTLAEGQTGITPEGYLITLEDIKKVCTLCSGGNYCGGCYSQAKLWYFTHDSAHTFYLKEGESKQFGGCGGGGCVSIEELNLLGFSVDGQAARFIIYQKPMCKEGEIEYVSCPEGFIENNWIKRKCENGKWNPNYASYPSPCSCSDNSVCKEGYSCVNNQCQQKLTAWGNFTLTGNAIELNPYCNGCSLNDDCLPTSYRTNDKYCDADKTLKYQKSDGQSCNNNFECKTNLCVDAKCISSGLIQKILDFFKKLFGG